MSNFIPNETIMIDGWDPTWITSKLKRTPLTQEVN